MTVETKSVRGDAAQREAFDRLLKDHMLYCCKFSQIV
jgi:predicted molibdopterin-dependent oxidoreductase YjgC